MRIKNIVVLTFCLFALSGCGNSKNHEDVLSDVEVQEINVEENVQETDEEDMVVAMTEPDELLDAFLASEIPAICENEQIVNGPYGGFYFDARDGKVYVLARGEGTAGVLSYAYYDNATWIVHRDTSHMGRQIFWLTKYDGEGNIVDEFMLGAEYWDTTDDKYDENSDFTYRDEKISMSEYEELRKEIIGW